MLLGACLSLQLQPLGHFVNHPVVSLESGKMRSIFHQGKDYHISLSSFHVQSLWSSLSNQHNTTSLFLTPAFLLWLWLWFLLMMGGMVMSMMSTSANMRLLSDHFPRDFNVQSVSGGNNGGHFLSPFSDAPFLRLGGNFLDNSSVPVIPPQMSAPS